MSNRLCQVRAELRSLSAAEAELWLVAEVEQVGATTDVRGRVVGPRCPGMSTIEVAYPLRPLPGGAAGAAPPLARRVVIPDPSLWEPGRPYVYRAVIELWEENVRCDRTEFDYSFRMGGAVQGGR